MPPWLVFAAVGAAFLWAIRGVTREVVGPAPPMTMLGQQATLGKPAGDLSAAGAPAHVDTPVIAVAVASVLTSPVTKTPRPDVGKIMVAPPAWNERALTREVLPAATGDVAPAALANSKPMRLYRPVGNRTLAASLPPNTISTAQVLAGVKRGYY